MKGGLLGKLVRKEESVEQGMGATYGFGKTPRLPCLMVFIGGV